MDVNLSKNEKAILQKIGRAGRKEMLRRLGQETLQLGPLQSSRVAPEVARERLERLARLKQYQHRGKSYYVLLEQVGADRLAVISSRQAKHGETGGRPSLYKPCPNTKPDAAFRNHRFKNEVCACGQQQLAKPIKPKRK